MINPQDYLKNPKKYGDVVILSVADYEQLQEIQDLEIVRQRKAKLLSGESKTITLDEFSKYSRQKLAERDL